jgi:hypothetical protein
VASSLLTTDEVTILTNASSLLVELEGNEWLPDELANVFAGLTARQSDANGFNALIQPTLTIDSWPAYSTATARCAWTCRRSRSTTF